MSSRTARITVIVLVLSLAVPASAYEIGHTTLTFYDPVRGNRSIPTEIFYPADTAGENVPLASGFEQFPLVSFGHGFIMSWSLYDYVYEGLVPQGYIVAYPDTEGELFPEHDDLGYDLAFVILSLRNAGTDAGSPFYGRVAATAAAMGHSMGGGASFLALGSDPSITAIANLAAAETNPSAITAAAGITAPALLFSGGNDCVTPPADHQIPMYDALASDCRTRVTIDGASHCQFAESNWACEFGEGSCPSPTISRSQQQATVMSLLLPWLDYTLKDDVLGWLDFDELLDSTPGITYEQSCVPTGATDPIAETLLSLSPSFPNPTSSDARARFHLMRPADVSVDIYSVSGRRIATIADGRRKAGWHTVSWDGTTASGHPAASGVYCWRIEAAGEMSTRAIVRVQ